MQFPRRQDTSSFSRGFYTLDSVLKGMGAQAIIQESAYIVHDTRGLRENDLVYYTAVKIADEIMGGIDRLTYSNTIDFATLFITSSGAQLVILARSFDEELIAPAFRSTLRGVSFDTESGYFQKYVIPILENDPEV